MERFLTRSRDNHWEIIDRNTDEVIRIGSFERTREYAAWLNGVVRESIQAGFAAAVVQATKGGAACAAF
jgi:hypothetical protein